MTLLEFFERAPNMGGSVKRWPYIHLCLLDAWR